MRLLGRLLFYVLWPVTWLYSPLFRRVRVVMIHQDSILIVKKWFGPGQWQLPGGGIHRGEKIEAAAKREIFEELGIEVTTFKRMHSEPIVMRQFGLLMRYEFVVANMDARQKIYRAKYELMDASWIPVSQITTSPKSFSAEIHHALHHMSKK